jgi:UPF0042 nucleotide-binding protein
VIKKTEQPNTLILIAGISGSGKTTAINFISDLGFYTLANLPVALLDNFLDFSRLNPERYSRTAILVDIDSTQSLEELLTFVKQHEGSALKIVRCFFDCNSETIIKRYSETRRPHPNFDAVRDKSLIDTIRREKSRLLPFKESAHFVVDTSDLSVHALKREIRSFVDSVSALGAQKVRVNFVSFGFKYGAPLDCDLVIDVRFLPNPHFVKGLREKTGKDADVSSYVFSFEEAQLFLTKYSDLLNFLIPRYVAEGKAYLNIGVGCTGGQHRSVAIAEELNQRLEKATLDCFLSVKHRDIERFKNQGS